MKILGISMGRIGKNCDIVVKQALMAAKDAGAEVKFMNTMRMKIGHCTGCGACSASRDKGGPMKCVLKDDYLALEHEVLEADGIILAVPVYSIAPSGQLKNFIDRFGAAHDLASATAEQEKRIKEGAEEMLDERLFRKKYVSYISVGGAHTPNWVSLGLPNMTMFGMSTCMIPVGQIDAYDMGHRTNPVLDPPFMERLSGLGRHMVDCVGKEREEISWYGDDGVCPVCHQNLISIWDTTDIECPVCGIKGKLSIDGEKVKVTYSEAEQKRARGKIDGLWEHHYELKDMMAVIIPKLEENKDTLPKLLAPFQDFENTY
jgi:multimeric flavodoxin WrbA